MPGGSREKQLVEELADQVCWDELRHSNLALACFRRCCSHDNVLLVATSDYRTFLRSNAPTDVPFREGEN